MKARPDINLVFSSQFNIMICRRPIIEKEKRAKTGDTGDSLGESDHISKVRQFLPRPGKGGCINGQDASDTLVESSAVDRELKLQVGKMWIDLVPYESPSPHAKMVLILRI
jgi:hypothetical protein